MTVSAAGMLALQGVGKLFVRQQLNRAFQYLELRQLVRLFQPCLCADFSGCCLAESRAPCL